MAETCIQLLFVKVSEVLNSNSINLKGEMKTKTSSCRSS